MKYVVVVYDEITKNVHHKLFDNIEEAKEHAKNSCAKYALKATVFKCSPVCSWKVARKQGNLTIFDFS